MLEEFFNSVSNDILQYGFSGFMLALLFSLFLVPTIFKLALTKNFTDTPSSRKSHSKDVPVLGGAAIYLSAIFAMLIVANIFPLKIDTNLFFLLGCTSTAIVFLGLVDDLLSVKLYVKLLTQFTLSIIVINATGYTIESMGGIFGVYQLSETFSFLLSVFVYVVFINMFNLIDGIDGLASSISLVGFGFFILVSYDNGSFENMLISMIGLGCILPFLYYNTLSRKKIFLGDNGSLFLGLVFGYFALHFLSPINQVVSFLPENYNLIVLMAVFSYPLVDTLRVFIVRLFSGKSPFLADKNHIHHILLQLGFSHTNATILIVLYTFFITTVSLFMIGININIAFFVLLGLAVFIICLPSFLLKRHYNFKFLNKK